MKPIVIYTYSFDMGIGGIKVMHKLCHLLNGLGYPAYLMPINQSDYFYVYYDNTPMITQDVLNSIEDTIVLYPEGVKYNPLGAKSVVRWMLGPPRLEDIQTYSDSDIIFWYMDYYYNPTVGQQDNKLFVAEYHSDIFYNRNLPRTGSCYTIRKCKDPKLVHPSDSIFIPFGNAGDLIGLAELFNRTEVFYCYDNYTFLSVQAAMCGCTSIVIPDGTKSKEEWLNGSELSKYGMAYGLDDIDRALSTVPNLISTMHDIEKETTKQLELFINKII